MTLNAGLDAMFRERRMLREAPERSMVTVVAPERHTRGQRRSMSGEAQISKGVES